MTVGVDHQQGFGVAFARVGGEGEGGEESRRRGEDFVGGFFVGSELVD